MSSVIQQKPILRGLFIRIFLKVNLSCFYASKNCHVTWIFRISPRLPFFVFYFSPKTPVGLAKMFFSNFLNNIVFCRQYISGSFCVNILSTSLHCVLYRSKCDKILQNSRFVYSIIIHAEKRAYCML